MTETVSEVVTIRVDKELKQKMRKYKIKPGEVARAAFEDEVKKKEEEEFLHALAEMQKILRKIPDGEIVKAIRESRDQR